MAYLTYNGQYVVSDGKYTSQAPPVTIQALDFDGSTYIQMSEHVALPTSDQFDVTFGMYLDTNSYSYESFFFTCDTAGPSPTHNCLGVYLLGDQLRVWGGLGSESRQADINSFVGANVNVTVSIDTTVGNYNIVDDIKFNGVSQALTVTGESFSFEDTFRIGITTTSFASYLQNATMWDLTIPTVGLWKGYPGDQNSGWEDQIGILDGTLTTVPPGHIAYIQTRPITL